MKLTVITAVRNVIAGPGAEALSRCIKSVSSLGEMCEHIVQDGCSDDGTSDVLRALASNCPHVKVFTEQDTGIYSALNFGLARARGDWVYILGADDYLMRPADLIAALEFGEGAGASIVASPVCTSEDGKRQLSLSKKDAFSSMPYPHQGLLMRRESILQCDGFNERYRISADADLLWRMLLSGERVVFYETPYAFYSLNGVSTGNEKIRTETKDILKKLLDLSDLEVANLQDRRVLPLRLALKFLAHTSPIIRATARFYLFRAVAKAFGLIGKNGALVWK